MVAMRSLDGLSPESFANAARDLFPGSATSVAKVDTPVIAFESDGIGLMVVPMPFPIPLPDIDSAVARSWMWPQAKEAMKHQAAHVLVTALGGPSPREAAMAATRMAAAVCRAGDPAGVYWGNGGHVIDPSYFIDLATDDEAPPVPLWVGLVVSSQGDRGPYSLSSCGMPSLGHMELEILDSTISPTDLVDQAYSIIAYLVENGPVLEHGHTFGPDHDTKHRVEHTKSVFRKGERVLRLHVP
jgi:hypothetical protein